jgi:hypothetical protein
MRRLGIFTLHCVAAGEGGIMRAAFFAGRDVAQPGSALAWGARGREFESRRPDQYLQDRLQHRWSHFQAGHFPIR